MLSGCGNISIFVISVEVGQKGGNSGSAMSNLFFLHALLSTDSEYIISLPLGSLVIEIFKFFMSHFQGERK